MRIRPVCSDSVRALSLSLSCSLGSIAAGAVAAPPVTMDKQTLQIRLVPAQSAEDRARNIIANVVVVEEGGHDSTVVPYIDDHEVVAEKKTLLTQLEAPPAPEAAPRLRYYTPGPSTYKLLCPLCRERSEAAVMRAAGCKDVSCALSLLSW